MRTVVIPGVLLMAGAEALMLLLRQGQLLAEVTGTVVLLLLLGVVRMLTGGDAGGPAERVAADDAGELLRRWRSSTESRIHWSQSTRIDWDRHWRPLLAARFEVATGQRRANDPAAFAAAGRILFGDEHWRWVDPTNVAATDDREPGPGRAVFAEILSRLDRR